MKKFKRLIAMLLVAFTIVTMVPEVSGNKKAEAAEASCYQTNSTTTSVTIKWPAYSGTRSVNGFCVGYCLDADSDASKKALDMARSKKYSYSKSTTSATIKGLKAGQKYWVVVLFEYTDSYGTSFIYHAGCYARTLYNKVTNLRVDDYYIPSSETSKASFTAEWTAKKYVDGYQVVVYSAGGTQISQKFTTSNSYTYSEAKYNSTYRVRVRSYVECNGTKKYSVWSSYLYVVMQPKMTYGKVNSKGQLALKWDKVSGANSYEIYVSTTGGRLGYKKVATTTGASKAVATLNGKKFNKNSTYYVFVRAVKTVGKTKIYSGTNYVWTVTP